MPIYSRRQSKPPPGTPIDWSHPLSSALVWCAPLNEGAGQTYDLISGVSYAPGTSTTWASSLYGTAVDFGAAGANITYGDVPAVSTATSLTVNVLAMARTSGNGTTLGRVITKNDGFPIAVDIDTSTDALVQIAGNSAEPASVAGLLNNWHVFTAVWVASTSLTMYVDGLQVATGTAAASLNSNTNPIVLGNREGNDRTFDGQIALATISTRAWSASEVSAFSGNPWQFFQPQQALWLMTPAAAAGPSPRGPSVLLSQTIPSQYEE